MTSHTMEGRKLFENSSGIGLAVVLSDRGSGFRVHGLEMRVQGSRFSPKVNDSLYKQ